MAKLTDFRDFYYLRGDHVIVMGKGYLQYPVGNDFIEGHDDPSSPIAKIRHNDEHNWVNIGLEDSWITLVDRPDAGTFVNRSGDSMFGDLRMFEDVRIRNDYGTSTHPSYTFLGDEDTGLLRNKENTVSLVLGSDINDIHVIEAERFGSGDYDTNIYMEGDVWIDEITFTRRGGLRLDGDYAYFTGSEGLRLTQGNTNQRPNLERAIIRYNNVSDNFEIGYDNSYQYTQNANSKWGILSLQKDTSSWFVRSGDSVFGDIQMTNDSRILLTQGTQSRPSLTFDHEKTTGWYHNSNGVSLTVRSNERTEDVITIHKTGNDLHDNDIYLNGDVYTNEITFTDLTLDGDYAHFTGTEGLKIPNGPTSDRVNENGVIRYNTSNSTYEFYNDGWLYASGNKDFDTWVNRKGDSIYGDLRFISGARVIAESGTASKPSYTYRNDEDTGLLNPSSDTIDIMVGGSVNDVPAIKIERTGIYDNDKRVIINGELIVHGERTILNTTTVTIEDNILTLNKNGVGSGKTGIEVEGDGSIKSHLLYNFDTNRWNVDNSLLGSVLSPEEDLDVTNKIYVDTEIDELRIYLEDLIQQEEDRAIAEEQRIEGRLDDEIDRATERENEIESHLNSEVLRIDYDILSTNISLENEFLRASKREDELEDIISDNNNEINSALQDEIERATNEEQRIEEKFDTEIDLVRSTKNELYEQCLNEIERVEFDLLNESILVHGRIDNLKSFTESNVSELDSRLSNEITRAINNENNIEDSLNTRIDNLEVVVDNGDINLQQQINDINQELFNMDLSDYISNNNVYNDIDQETEGYVLDARQAVVLAGMIEDSIMNAGIYSEELVDNYLSPDLVLVDNEQDSIDSKVGNEDLVIYRLDTEEKETYNELTHTWDSTYIPKGEVLHNNRLYLNNPLHKLLVVDEEYNAHAIPLDEATKLDKFKEKEFQDSGYQRLPSGLLIQWKYGVTNPAVPENGEFVTFPVPFDNGVLNVQVSDNSSNCFSVGASGEDSTGATLYARNVTDGSYVGFNYYIFAVGF